MDATAMSVAMSALANANANVGGMTRSGTGTTGTDFSQLLLSMMGGGLGSGLDGMSSMGLLGSGGLMGDSGMDMTGLLGGMNWEDMQMSMMAEAMQSLMDSENPVVTDPVLAQLMQTLKGGGEDELMNLLEQMKKRLLEVAEENGAQMAGQQALALFPQLMNTMGMPMSNTMLSAFSADGGQNLLQLMTESTPENLLAVLNGTTGTRQTQSEAEGFSQAMQNAAGQLEADVKSVQVNTQPAQRPDFQQAVREVIARMEKADAEMPEETKALDVDTLQQNVEAGVYLRNTAMADGLPTAQMTAQPTATVATQLYDGLAAANASGAEEVVVKLAPEELGEVTIRLSKTVEGMSLTLIAKNPETQQLLTAQLSELQDKMQPYKVAVENILTERQYEMLSHQQSFDGQRRQSWSTGNMTYYGPGESEDEPGQGAPDSVRVQTNAGLDTYI